MRVVLLGAALVLISASLVAFLWGGPTPGNVVAGRSIVSGHVRGDLAGHPWAGTIAALGTEHVLLGEDGEFKFAMMPGRYYLKVCCSDRFQAIDRDVVVEQTDIALDLEVHPLMEIKGHLAIQGGTQVPYGLLVSASQDGTNVVDRAATSVDGSFTFHLMEGEWELHMDNLPSEYQIVSITLGEDKVRDRKFTLGRASRTAASLPLQIALK